MKKDTFLSIVGILLIGGGLYGLTLKIDNTGHYFGTGTFFGIGMCLVVEVLFRRLTRLPKIRKVLFKILPRPFSKFLFPEG